MKKINFLDRVQKSPNCWIWTGRLTEKGYGAFRQSHAHRFSYEFHKGEITDGLYVLHHCDNRSCVNPEHLFLGTQLDNMRDCAMKGRTARGEKSVKSKLKECDVHWIRQNYKLSEAGNIANRFGITRTQLYRVKSRRSWTHI